ncbi:uncharacterized protein [Spinacia oleracea]|uniref:PGG domain-containing protein n=1 Tax=Spinacia oleracea TaxID=3562 RepID=A0ABM3QK26_SPIOL|nr:uncharacterized protein LOC130460076 [Spinacia oleracea]
MELGKYSVGWDGLVALAEQGHVEHILRILEKDLNLMYTTNMVRETVVHVVVRAGNAFTVTKLLKFKGSDQLKEKVLLKQNVDGDTALHLAIKLKHMEVAYQLVDWNITWMQKWMYNLLNNDGLSPVDLAKEAVWFLPRQEVLSAVAYADMRVSRMDIELEELYKVKWIEGTPRGIRGAFSKASANGIIKTMHIELELDRKGGNLLHIAARLGKLDVLKLLIKFMSNSELATLPIERNKNGYTALHLALIGKHEAIALCLIKAAPKATAYLLNQDGQSPLFWAIERRYKAHFPANARNCH